MDWGDLVDEGSLPTQGPFPFHAGGSESIGTVEPGLPLGPVGAGGSAVTVGVLVEDRWMGGDGSEAVLEVLVDGGGSDAVPRELMEGGGSDATPQEMMERSGSGAVPHETVEGSGSGAAPHEVIEESGSGAAPHETMEGSGFGAAPHETREMSPPASEQGAGWKRSRPHELEQGSGGSSPKHTRRPKASEYVTDSPRFSLYFSVLILRFFPIL